MIKKYEADIQPYRLIMFDFFICVLSFSYLIIGYDEPFTIYLKKIWPSIISVNSLDK